MIQAVVFIVGMLGGVSLIVGGVIAVAVVIWAQDMAAAIGIISNSYYGLIALMPIALWLALFATRDDSDYEDAYDTKQRAIATTLQGALVGSALGAGPIFLAMVIYLPVILSDFRLEEYGSAVRDAIVWSQLSLAIGAACLSALPLGYWAFYTGSGRDD